MADVEAVIPENVASSQSQQIINSSENNAMNAASSSNITISSSIASPLKDQLNGDKNQISEKPEVMDVDAPDTEEDDSQITSSTENGNATGDSRKISEQTGKRRGSSQPTSSENSKDESVNDADSTVIKDKLENVSKSNLTSSNEDSSNACDAISRNCDESPFNKADQNSDSELPAAVDTEEEEENSAATGTNNRKRSLSNADERDKDHTDGDAASQDASSDVRTNSRQQDFNEDMISLEAKDEKSTDVPVDECSVSQECIEDPLNSSEIEKNNEKKSHIQKENGAASELEKAKNDAGIVDLDDDSDEEMDTNMPKEPLVGQSNGNDSSLNYSAKKTKSVCSDSDGAVVIGSDSENEADEMTPVSKQPHDLQNAEKVNSTQEIADDDDDDCVVIEDDTPAPSTFDVTKRKSLAAVDLAGSSDDSQPPSKRQRTSLPASNVSQITIKDARSLMPQSVSTVTKDIPVDTNPVFPVNIRPSPILATPSTSPPKLVPVSNSLSMHHVGPGSTLPGLNSNTNLLPGLTDDMYVLEAPSFIVPYIYEKPPTDNLKDIVKVIETKFELTKEDLADADRSDEFDMMTEQNKGDKEEKSSKKKKRRRGGDDNDESWSEESDEEDDDEDDEDSEGGVRTKVLIKELKDDDFTAIKGAIKPAAAVTNVSTGDAPSTANTASKPPGQENYFESPLGKFFMDIGVGLVQEFVQSDLIRLQKRKMRKSLGKNITEFERAIAALSGNLEASKKKNSPFRFTMKRCEFCNFKSESALSMANHYETPHMNGQMFKCNFCTYEIRSDKEIMYHMEAVHNIKARLIKPLPYHQCPNCSFEDNGKAKLGRHQPVCAKKFRPELNLAPPHDWEAPAKIPRIKPRHGLVGTATAYQAMAAQAAAQKAALASIQQQQQQAAQARSIQAAALAAQNAANKIRGRPPTISTKPGLNPGSPQMRGPNQVRNPMANNIVMPPNNYQLAGAQLLQNANAMAKKTLSGQPSISITPLPRQSGSAQVSTPSSSKMPPAGMKPGQSPGGNKAQFVICEICDGYIKDLEQLRNHMQWMHKVKIHPKMIYNRPPLNCQKCQFRFFTDQGLERHLLGSHGLVTSSMQEAANKGKDAGRCPVCGRLYQWKLLNHVSRDHHMTLKPAHLSYKCTVCTATFGMYKQFETHVYTAHSTVAKKAMDGKKNNNATTSTMASGSQRSSLGASNDSLLKPLKINDEITIIPQPASKSRITNMESHVID